MAEMHIVKIIRESIVCEGRRALYWKSQKCLLRSCTVKPALWIRTSVIPGNISSLYDSVSSRYFESEKRSKELFEKVGVLFTASRKLGPKDIIIGLREPGLI
ncbi:hypothetical protein CDAR_121931 [Caerostris darwini]|uniref:Uncharacterized protein n=1 Tax=Caerostris darwini TaxID=1538125 RepID=A0AAV4R3M0_9ARAC|nr:hypothetical protein CDAR_121931 [Caerostris darwini]